MENGISREKRNLQLQCLYFSKKKKEKKKENVWLDLLKKERKEKDLELLSKRVYKRYRFRRCRNNSTEDRTREREREREREERSPREFLLSRSFVLSRDDREKLRTRGFRYRAYRRMFHRVAFNAPFPASVDNVKRARTAGGEGRTRRSLSRRPQFFTELLQ